MDLKNSSVKNLFILQRFCAYDFPLLFSAIIPGPGEPNTSEMNYILKPLVDELLELEKGVDIGGMRVRGKQICLCSDLPASRKALGLLACTANKGRECSYYIDAIKFIM